MREKLLILKSFWSIIDQKYKNQSKGLLVLMVISAFSEVVSIGLVFPFLTALLSPEKVFLASNLQSTLVVA